MKGITLTFKKKTQVASDALNNPVNDIVEIVVDNCLIGPMSEPADAREQQAMHQAKDQVRIHLPKTFTGDVSNSYVLWDGKVFHLDSDSVVFMNENTPTAWNRYFRAEYVGQSEDSGLSEMIGFFITEDSDSYLQQESV